MGYQIASIVLGPLLYFQGKAVRRSIPILPEPEGAREGQIGSGKPLRLLVLGDSAAAGVGATYMHESLMGQLLEQLRARYALNWCLIAKTGATTASTLKHLAKQNSRVSGTADKCSSSAQRGSTSKPAPFDVCITSLGVNDVTSGMGVKAWLAQQEKLRHLLQSEFGIKHLISCGLPPIHGFPSLPQPLRWWLGARATAFNNGLQKSIEGTSGVSFFSLRFTEDQTLMASDGFHPGPAVYREWAQRAAQMIDEVCATALRA